MGTYLWYMPMICGNPDDYDLAMTTVTLTCIWGSLINVSKGVARARSWVTPKSCSCTHMTPVEHVVKIFTAVSNTWRSSIPHFLLVWFINSSANADRIQPQITAVTGSAGCAVSAVRSTEYLPPSWSFLNHQLHLYVKLTI